MTQIERIIQGLMLIQRADPDVNLQTTAQIIYAIVDLPDQSINRLMHIGWLWVQGAEGGIAMFKTDESEDNEYAAS